MARRQKDRLSAKAVANARKPGYYGDGGNLWLQVSAAGTKSWLFRFALSGMLTKTGKPKTAEMGLGPLDTVSLADARRRAADARVQVLDGINPIEARKAKRVGEALESAKSISFSEAAKQYIKAHRAGWKNAKHANQWTSTLETYAEPVFGALPVQGVDTGLVLKALEPIWTEKPETATRLRGRIESVLDWATARGYRTGDNPARWRGHLDNLLPSLSKRRRVQHHPALAFDAMGEFIESLHDQEGTAARALEFTILTAARTGEVIGARWEEIDQEGAMWTIPPARMKAHREHRVPLSPRAAKLLQALYDARQGDYVFPGQRPGKPLSNMAMLELLKRMKRTDLTVHGFRSTFRDWASERTSYPREVCEMALAHAVGNQVEAAYRRGDLFEKRHRLMLEWEKFCSRPEGSKVLKIGKAA